MSVGDVDFVFVSTILRLYFSADITV